MLSAISRREPGARLVERANPKAELEGLGPWNETLNP